MDERPELVFNGGQSPTPCPHLAWVDARYEQWEHPAHGVGHVIGSIDLNWNPFGPEGEERLQSLLPYLNELVEHGPGWDFSPPEPFVQQLIDTEETASDASGRTWTPWEVDGWALFAANPAAFWAALPACQQRHLTALEARDQGEDADTE
jgi:hypothetical protein